MDYEYHYQTDLADILRAAGLAVVEVPGWKARGHHDGPFRPRALVFHHDASPPGPSPGALEWLINGYASDDDSNYDAQCWVDRAGTWHVIAAGRAQHAGSGSGWGAIDAEQGNTEAIGVETDHTTGEEWVPVQLASVRRGMAAICRARGWDPRNAVVGHKEYAPGRKDDPDGVDLNLFRRQVSAEINAWEDDVSAEQVWTEQIDVDSVPEGTYAHASYPAGEVVLGANYWAMQAAHTGAAISGEIAGLTDAIKQLAAHTGGTGGAGVDLDAVRAAAQAGAEAGAADALARIRLTVTDPPVAGK